MLLAYHSMVNLAKKPFPFRRYTLIAVALAGLGTGAWFLGQNRYHHWRAGRLAQQAGAFFGKNDLSSAALSAQRGLSFDTSSIDCWKILAEVGEARRQSNAIYARSRVVDLEKGSLDSIIRCARTALKLGNPQAAADALEKLGQERRSDAEYQALRGQVGVATGKLELAVEGYSEALKLEPKNDYYRLAYATALLDRGWIEDRATARAALKNLSALPALRREALRALLKDSITNKEMAGSLDVARELTSAPDAKFSDKITLLDLLHRYDSGGFRSALQGMKEEARGNAGKIIDLAFWMDRNGLDSEAVEWADHFAPEDWADPHVCGTLAVNILRTRNWTKLQTFTESGNWGSLEYFRLALLARSVREQGNFTLFQTIWNSAIAAAAHLPHATGRLARAIAGWGLETQYIELLRTLLKDPNDAGWASQALLPIMTQRRDTSGLWEATGRFLEVDANNDAAANNFVIYSLLLGRETMRACELAAKLYARHPYEGNYVSTYAYSLHVRGRTDEALKVMEALSPQQLESPDVAVYYGILLASAHDWARAPKYLEQRKNAHLLPEEEALVRTAVTQMEEARLKTAE